MPFSRGPSRGKPLPGMDIKSSDASPNRKREINFDKRFVEMRNLTQMITRNTTE